MFNDNPYIMTEQEIEELRKKRDDSGLNPEIKTLRRGAVVMNADRTGTDKAAVGSTWKEYWQIFTLQDFPSMCPLCGKQLIKDNIDGCHIKIYHANTKHWSLRKYIVPGHHSCNVSLVNPFQLQISAIAVQAIEK